MMSVADSIIQVAGRQVTIYKSAKTVKTYMVADATGPGAGKSREDPKTDYEMTARLPSTSGVASGDLLKCGNEYFIAMSVEEKFFQTKLAYYRCMLYKCNALITIMAEDPTTKKYTVTVKGNVHCLLKQGSGATSEDKAYFVSSYRGKATPFDLIMRESEGLTRNHIIIDQDARRYRVMKDFDVYASGGITQTSVLWENP